MHEIINLHTETVDLTNRDHWTPDNIDLLINAAGFVVDDNSRRVMKEYIEKKIPGFTIFALVPSAIYGELLSAGCKKTT